MKALASTTLAFYLAVPTLLCGSGAEGKAKGLAPSAEAKKLKAHAVGRLVN